VWHPLLSVSYIEYLLLHQLVYEAHVLNLQTQRNISGFKGACYDLVKTDRPIGFTYKTKW
jgi:hypothetical protein